MRKMIHRLFQFIMFFVDKDEIHLQIQLTDQELRRKGIYPFRSWK